MGSIFHTVFPWKVGACSLASGHALPLAILLFAAAAPWAPTTLTFFSTAALAVLRVVGPLVAVHVAVGGEGLSADLAGEGPLPRVDQHVAVQGAEGGEHLTTQAAVVHLRLACERKPLEKT